MFRDVGSAPAASYPVPWRVDRVIDTHPLLTNAGAEPVEHVRTFGSHGTSATTERLGRVLPGETIDLCLCGTDLDSAVMTVCWFRPSTGVEYAWRFVM